MKCVPEVCQSIAELGVLAGLVRRKNSKLRAVNGGRRTDSVPGHQVFNNLEATRNIRFQLGEQYGNTYDPVSDLAPASPSINFHISRAVLPVRAIWFFPSLAYRCVMVILEWPKILASS